MASDLAHGGEFEPEHHVEEDAAVHVGFGEAVGARIELLPRPARPGCRADRDWRGNGRACGRRGSASARGWNRASPASRRRRKLDALGLRLGGDLVAELLLGLGPLAVERGDQVAVRRAAASSACSRRRRARSWRRRRPRPSGPGKTRAIRRRPRRGWPRSGRRGLRYRRRWRRRGKRCGRRRRWRPGGTWWLFPLARAKRASPVTVHARSHAAPTPLQSAPGCAAAYLLVDAIYDASKSSKDLRTESGLSALPPGFSRFGPATVIP